MKGYRDRVFVMTKFDARTQKPALQQRDESLDRLQVDHLDLWQFHENIRLEDPDRSFADGGACEAVIEAKQKGKIRFSGFTGHKDPSVHLRMLELAEKHEFNFDTAQMPLNVMDAHFQSFGKEVVPVLVKKHIAVLGMKSMGSGFILKSNTLTPTECLHYALSLPTSVVITGIDSQKVLDQACAAAKTSAAVTPSVIAKILQKTAAVAADGKFEHSRRRRALIPLLRVRSGCGKDAQARARLRPVCSDIGQLFAVTLEKQVRGKKSWSSERSVRVRSTLEGALRPVRVPYQRCARRPAARLQRLRDLR